MSRWMVNVRGQSFSASSMDELRSLAKKGDLGGGDIVQPPGASEWLYAVEIPELKASLRPDSSDLDIPDATTGMSPMVKGVLAGLMALVATGVWGYAISLKNALPKRDEPLTLLDESGARGLSFREVLVTSPMAVLKAEPDAASADITPMKKDDKATLLAKRGGWYKLNYGGKEGYAPVDTVVAAYFFTDDETKLNYDPLYNPDKYVFVANASWTLPADKAKKGLSEMSAMLQNDSKFPMTDIKVVATLKDAAGQVMTQKEITVEGTIAPNHSDMLGTLSPAKGDKTTPPRVLFTSDFEKMVAEDPSVGDRWMDGVEVQVGDDTTSEASVTIVEVRAVPPEDAPK